MDKDENENVKNTSIESQKVTKWIRKKTAFFKDCLDYGEAADLSPLSRASTDKVDPRFPIRIAINHD